MITTEREGAGRFVVGVDGSEESRAALRWSADEAVAHGARLEVVCAWELPFSGLASSYAAAPTGLPSAQETSRRAEDAVDRTVREVLGADGPVDLVRVVESGDPATVLLRRSEGADLLVVGSRGHGGFGRLLLGSVSEKCVRHATCSVMVIRPAAVRARPR
jgi:nucleotide-binding universal stress UspA family protein